jgi:hypothetical protein
MSRRPIALTRPARHGAGTAISQRPTACRTQPAGQTTNNLQNAKSREPTTTGLGTLPGSGAPTTTGLQQQGDKARRKANELLGRVAQVGWLRLPEQHHPVAAKRLGFIKRHFGASHQRRDA